MSIDKKTPPALAVLGLDIGGTEIKAALVNGEGDIIASQRAATPMTFTDLQQTLGTFAAEFHLEDADIRGAGVGCKGIIDPHTTEVLALPGELNYLEGRRLAG